MAINRFRRVAPQLDQTRYDFTPTEILPDLGMLNMLVTPLQKDFDTLGRIPIPKHIDNDRDDVQNYFVAPVKSLKEEAVQAFKNQDVTQGRAALTKAVNFLQEAKQPGGLYYSFENNYQKVQDYIKTIQDNKDLSKETKDFAVQKALKDFRTIDQNQLPRTFSGYTPAKDVDLNKYFDELVKGWAATDFVKNYQLTLNGQYYDRRTGKKIDKAEIINTLSSSYLNDPEVRSYYTQLMDMKGPQAAQQVLQTAISTAAEKYAFDSEFSQLYSNKEYEQRQRMALERYKKKLDEDDPTTTITRPFMLNPAEAKPVKVKDGKVVIEPGGMQLSPLRTTPRLGDSPVTINQQKTDNRGFNQLITDPKMKGYFDTRPGLRQLVESTPATGMSPQQYNQLISQKYESLTSNSGVAIPVQTLNQKQIKEANNFMLGEKEGTIGAIVNHTVTLLSPSGRPQLLTPEELQKAKDNITFYGKSDGGNGFKPGALFGTYMKGKKAFDIVVEPISYESAVHYQPLKALSMPLISNQETPWQQVVLPGKGVVTAKTKPVFRYEGTTLVDKDIELFIKDEQGREVKIPNANKSTLQALYEQTAAQQNADDIKTDQIIK